MVSTLFGDATGIIYMEMRHALKEKLHHERYSEESWVTACQKG